MLVSIRKVSIPFVADAKLPIFWPDSKKLWSLHQICDFWGANWTAGLTRLKFLSQIDQNICTKNYQNSVFVSKAVHGELIIWNNQIFEEGYLSHPKIFEYNCLIYHSTRPQIYFGIFVIYFCRVITKPNIQWKWKWSNIFFKFLSSEIMELGKKWGTRYTFWYIVLLTLYNGDRRIVHWLSWSCT